MEKEEKSQKGTSRAAETDFVLQWGSRKRLRCAKLKKRQNLNSKSPDCSGGKKKLNCRSVAVAAAEKDDSCSFPLPLPQRLNKNCSSPMSKRKSSMASPEKEDRYYTTRGSLGMEENGKVLGLDHHGHAGDEREGFVWPKMFLSLSSKEKEEDFMAMKGCKLPQRPKKRAKLLQRSLLLVMPGTWLSDLCQERYEVREKKAASKKRPRGLKAMGSVDGESD